MYSKREGNKPARSIGAVENWVGLAAIRGCECGVVEKKGTAFQMATGGRGQGPQNVKPEMTKRTDRP